MSEENTTPEQEVEETVAQGDGQEEVVEEAPAE